jgi:hydroxymethylbilane synthase
MLSTSKTLVIGSRGSQLALWQARHIAACLEREGTDSRIEIIKTTGDHLQTASLTQAGGKGLFTKEIEEALLAGTIDLAVHSLKDLPTSMPTGLILAAIPERESPFDAIAGSTLRELPKGATVGTSSLRRSAQLRLLRPDLIVKPIRGNVDTRLRKLHSGEFQAILLAAAGLRRLGLQHEIAEVFTARQICPAPGQGALAIQTRLNDAAVELCRPLHHAASGAAVDCERSLLAELGGGCQLPVGAFAETSGDELQLVATVVSPDGSQVLHEAGHGMAKDAVEIGRRVAQLLLTRGAAALLAFAPAEGI